MSSRSKCCALVSCILDTASLSSLAESFHLPAALLAEKLGGDMNLSSDILAASALYTARNGKRVIYDRQWIRGKRFSGFLVQVDTFDPEQCRQL